MNNEIVIRSAGMEDVEAIAKVHVQSWKETSPGIMPKKKLASLTVESSRRKWKDVLSTDGLVLVSVVNDEFVGFVNGGKNKIYEGCKTGEGNTCEAELKAIYMLRSYHGRGIGRIMFEQLITQMANDGFRSMVSWVVEQNPAKKFYEKMGGELVDQRTLIICDEPVSLIAYRNWL